MSDLYDLGANDAHADDLTSLGSPGAGSYSDDREPPGEDTSGRTLNVAPDPGLDPLTTGEFHVTDFALHQQQQIDLLHKMVAYHEKKIAYKETRLIRALPIRSATGIFRANIGTLAGWSVRESAGQALTIDIFDSLDGSNMLYLATIQLAANGADKFYMMPNGIDFTQGIYLKLTGTGNAVGALWLAD